MEGGREGGREREMREGGWRERERSSYVSVLMVFVGTTYKNIKPAAIHMDSWSGCVRVGNTLAEVILNPPPPPRQNGDQ